MEIWPAWSSYHSQHCSCSCSLSWHKHFWQHQPLSFFIALAQAAHCYSARVRAKMRCNLAGPGHFTEDMLGTWIRERTKKEIRLFYKGGLGRRMAGKEKLRPERQYSSIPNLWHLNRRMREWAFPCGLLTPKPFKLFKRKVKLGLKVYTYIYIYI